MTNLTDAAVTTRSDTSVRVHQVGVEYQQNVPRVQNKQYIIWFAVTPCVFTQNKQIDYNVTESYGLSCSMILRDTMILLDKRGVIAISISVLRLVRRICF